MLQITIPAGELFDEVNQEFIYTEARTLQLEHSLVSVSKWESKWCKPFLGKDEKTDEETMDYIRCMIITQNVDPSILRFLTRENVKAINEYIEAPMTATTFGKDLNKPQARNREVVTAEIIYYWMIANQIPIEFQKWHLNKLLTLIRVCNEKAAPPKKMGKRELMSRNAQLNAARRKQLNTRG